MNKARKCEMLKNGWSITQMIDYFNNDTVMKPSEHDNNIVYLTLIAMTKKDRNLYNNTTCLFR